MKPSPENPPAFAPIENLDPEPPDQGRRGRRWEVLLGLALLLGLVGLGGWQWGQQQSKLTAYQAGARAAAAHDWDAARASFATAADYGDAARRRADADRLGAARGGQYAAAVQAAGRADCWSPSRRCSASKPSSRT